jgi:hypothetical protein
MNKHIRKGTLQPGIEPMINALTGEEAKGG